MPNISSFFYEDPAELYVPTSRGIVQRSLLSQVILMIHPLFRGIFPDYLNTIIIGSIKHRRLPVAIHIIQTESLAQ
jgi:hypothetical protein